MRHVARTLVLALVAGLLAAAPVAASTTAVVRGAPSAVDTVAVQPKIAIIVGPTETVTATYKSDADAAYATAIQYTPNVVKVYSPNATWSAVQAAVAGASIVVYLGHGNGWPAPYPWDPTYSGRDGFGLNDPANLSDSVHKYYGEPYVSTLQFAPNAVVLLNHLCYASGSSEPGNPAPTQDVAQQRVDNYGAGFLKGGAAAVIADGHSGMSSLIASLFTTHQSVYDAWRAMPDANGNTFSFASSRTPGATAAMDPEQPTGGYYRSFVGSLSVRTEDVIGAPIVTDQDPATLTVPGAAKAASGGAPLRAAADPTSTAQGSLAAGTAVRLEASQVTATTTGGTPDATAYEVQTLDGGTQGWTDGSALIPKDSTPPVILKLTAPPSFLVGSGTYTLGATFSETVTSTLTLKAPDGSTVVTAAGSGTAATVGWNGLIGGKKAPTGSYTWSVAATDAWGNVMAPTTGTVAVGSPTDPGTFIALPPSRLLDTRVGNGLSGAFTPNVPRTFQVAGRGGVPADAIAVTGNLTMTNATRAGYVSLTPAPDANPSTSTINFPAGDTRANGVTVPLGSGGTLSAVYGGSGSVALIFDVTGYFIAGTGGASYVALPPSRLLDTRVGNGLSGAFTPNVPRTFQVAGRGGVPADAIAVTGNLTMTNATRAGYVSLTPAPDANPSTSTINFPAGDTRANGVTVPLGSGGTLSAVYKGSGTVALIFDVTGYFFATP